MNAGLLVALIQSLRLMFGLLENGASLFFRAANAAYQGFSRLLGFVFKSSASSAIETKKNAVFSLLSLPEFPALNLNKAERGAYLSQTREARKFYRASAKNIRIFEHLHIVSKSDDLEKLAGKESELSTHAMYRASVANALQYDKAWDFFIEKADSDDQPALNTLKAQYLAQKDVALVPTDGVVKLFDMQRSLAYLAKLAAFDAKRRKLIGFGGYALPKDERDKLLQFSQKLVDYSKSLQSQLVETALMRLETASTNLDYSFDDVVINALDLLQAKAGIGALEKIIKLSRKSLTIPRRCGLSPDRAENLIRYCMVNGDVAQKSRLYDVVKKNLGVNISDINLDGTIGGNSFREFRVSPPYFSRFFISMSSLIKPVSISEVIVLRSLERAHSQISDDNGEFDSRQYVRAQLMNELTFVDAQHYINAQKLVENRVALVKTAMPTSFLKRFLNTLMGNPAKRAINKAINALNPRYQSVLLKRVGYFQAILAGIENVSLLPEEVQGLNDHVESMKVLLAKLTESDDRARLASLIEKASSIIKQGSYLMSDAEFAEIEKTADDFQATIDKLLLDELISAGGDKIASSSNLTLLKNLKASSSHDIKENVLTSFAAFKSAPPLAKDKFNILMTYFKHAKQANDGSLVPLQSDIDAASALCESIVSDALQVGLNSCLARDGGLNLTNALALKQAVSFLKLFPLENSSENLESIAQFSVLKLGECYKRNESRTDNLRYFESLILRGGTKQIKNAIMDVKAVSATNWVDAIFKINKLQREVNEVMDSKINKDVLGKKLNVFYRDIGIVENAVYHYLKNKKILTHRWVTAKMLINKVRVSGAAVNSINLDLTQKALLGVNSKSNKDVGQAIALLQCLDCAQDSVRMHPASVEHMQGVLTNAIASWATSADGALVSVVKEASLDTQTLAIAQVQQDRQVMGAAK